jgi:cation diffusion facilitator family transporter
MATSRKAVYAGLIGNLLVAVTKFVAAAITGSSAMLSEGVHSVVDTGNELLLLHGLRRAERPPDRGHPLGHGRELYFWSFVVALMVFAIGAGVSLYEGVQHILAPEPVENAVVSYAVLGLSVLFEGGSWLVAWRAFRAASGGADFMTALRRSKDPATFTVLLEDTAALVGLAIAFAGILASQLLDRPELDGAASIAIAGVLAVTAFVLGRETKDLLIGERAAPAIEAAILRIAAGDPAVHRANGVTTVHLAPDQVVAALSAEFEDRATAPEIEACILRIEAKLRGAFPEITRLYVKPQTAGEYAARVERIRAAEG